MATNKEIKSKTYESAFNEGYKAALESKQPIDIEDSMSESYLQELLQDKYDDGFNAGYQKAKKEGEA